MNSLIEHAKRELALIPKDEDGFQDRINKNILDIVELFSNQHHSGMTAPYCINLLEKLLSYNPISPLTGEDDEWNNTGHGTLQNKRCTRIFKHPDGKCYDIEGIIVSDNGGITWFMSGNFRKEITFPYTVPNEPERVYIEYTEEVPVGFTSDEFEIITDKPERIKALYDKKRKEFDEAIA